MEPGRGVEEEEPPAPDLAQLLQSHSVDTIIAWLSVGAGKKKETSGKNSIIIEKLKQYHHLRPHFATNFTDFLHEDCKHLLGVEEPAGDSAAPVSAERGPAARRRLPVDPAPIQVRRSDRPGPAPRTETGPAARPQQQPGGGRSRRPATEPRPTTGARRVQLADLLVSSEPRSARRGRRPARPVTPEQPPAAAEAGRWEKLSSRLGPAGGGLEPRRSAPAPAPAPARTAEEAGFVTPVKQLMRRDPAGSSPASAALPESVTGAERLAQLAALYAHLIEHNLLLGLSIELNFLVRLLVTPGGSGPPPPEARFLTTVHNAVFFSVRTLWLLRELLGFLDAANLRLLATNERLVSFHPELADALLELPARRPCVSPPPGAADDQRPDSLTFYAELVYRPNFPSDASFNAFRRQHDLFHALVERWRAAGGDWDAEAALGDEPRALVSLCAHPVNMHHLARLYQAQLLRLAGDGGGGTEAASLLLQADRSRLQRLSDRFLKPSCAGRAGGRRDFPGAEELFRQLLVRADSAAFSAALRDLLASSLLQLDQQTLQLPDTGVLPSTVREASDRIFRLRLLAKFLGLVTFRGLHSDTDIPEQVLTSSIQMRNRVPPPLDLLSCLEGAVRRRQLVTTLPWMIEYLCMMDRVSVLTAAHQTVFSLLVTVFRSLAAAPGLTRHNALFLRLQYENLYEIHSHVQNLCEKDSLSAMDRRRMERLQAEFCRLYLARRPAEAQPAADSWDLVRPGLFYVCCPQLTEQKVALLQFRAGRSYQPSPSLRKIIPISARPADTLTAATRRTQSELEEAFFQSHHPSLRRTAAFAVERLASALIKLLRGSQLSAETAPLLRPLRAQLAERLERGHQDYQIKSWLAARLSAVVLAQHAAVVSQLAAVCRGRVAPLVSDALGALLVGEELTEGARRTVHRLTEAGVLSRVNCWLNTNVTRDFLQQVMEGECRAELRRRRRAPALPLSPPAAPLADLPDSAADVLSPAECLLELKNTVCGVLSGARLPSGPELERLLARVAAVQAQWGRLVPAAARSLHQLCRQLVTALAAVRPELLGPAALEVRPADLPPAAANSQQRQEGAAPNPRRETLTPEPGVAVLEGAAAQEPAPEDCLTEDPAAEEPAPEDCLTEDPAAEEACREDLSPEGAFLVLPAPEDCLTEDPAAEEACREDASLMEADREEVLGSGSVAPLPAPEEVPGSESAAPLPDRSPERAALVSNCWSRRRPLLQLS